MRIAELANETGTSIPTLKYYLREGLLPPGRRTAPNQADYGDEHVHRVRLVRALTDVGRLSLNAVRQVIAAAEDPNLSIHEVFGVAQRTLHQPPAGEQHRPSLEQAQQEIDAYLERLGWRVKGDAPARRDLAAALWVLRDLGWQVDAGVFDIYARAADGIARWEIDQVPSGDTPAEQSVENVVVGTVVFEVVLAALRRLSQEHHSAMRFGETRR